MQRSEASKRHGHRLRTRSYLTGIEKGPRQNLRAKQREPCFSPLGLMFPTPHLKAYWPVASRGEGQRGSGHGRILLLTALPAPQKGHVPVASPSHSPAASQSGVGLAGQCGCTFHAHQGPGRAGVQHGPHLALMGGASALRARCGLRSLSVPQTPRRAHLLVFTAGFKGFHMSKIPSVSHCCPLACPLPLGKQRKSMTSIRPSQHLRGAVLHAVEHSCMVRFPCIF